MSGKRPYLSCFFEEHLEKDSMWLTKFFTHDIFIFGLGLSFIETELWWLLSYRRRFILENPQYNISNKIYYFYAVFKGNCDDEQLSLLESMGVEIRPVQLIRNGWKELYKKILMEIKGIIAADNLNAVEKWGVSFIA